MTSAVVVGINQYATMPLKCAANDAIAMARTLEACSPPFEVELLLDEQATASAIRAAISALSASPNDPVLIYLAGHAGLDANGARFVSFDATAWDECVGFNDIASLVKTKLVGGQAVIVVLDCCHAGALEVDTKLSQKDYRDAISGEFKDTNSAALLACTVGSSAREDNTLGHGIFTHLILAGMNGGAADSDGVVSTDGLYRYVAKEMERRSYGKPAYKASVVGRFRVTANAQPSSRSNSISRAVSVDLSQLADMLAKTDEKLAELRPPFSSRDQWRDSGWLTATKLVESIASKKRSAVSKWSARLESEPGWAKTRDDIDGLVGDLATVSTGTQTEFGRIVRKIGDGGFGNVYEIDTGQELRLAFKVFHARDLGNNAKLERFRIGYRAMNQLAHPRIVKVHKAIESPVSFFMEYIEGQNIRRWYGSETEPAELVRIMTEIVQVVEYAHGMGVLHRDIKPENVIIRWSKSLNRWEPVLTDFDLAWFESATSYTVEAFGAPFYAAPEQLTDPGKSVAHQPTVDVYALAMLLVYMITGEDPASIQDSIEGLKHRTNSWLSRSAVDIIVDLIEAGSRRNPDERDLTTSEFRSQLISAREKMLASSRPDVPLDIPDFVGRFEAVLGQPTREVGPAEHRGRSASGRVDFTIRWHGQLLELELSKLDAYAAVGMSNAQAREVLGRRLTADIERVSAQDSNLAQVRRTSRGGNTRIEFRGLPQTSAGASSVARLTAELVATYERF